MRRYIYRRRAPGHRRARTSQWKKCAPRLTRLMRVTQKPDALYTIRDLSSTPYSPPERNWMVIGICEVYTDESRIPMIIVLRENSFENILNWFENSINFSDFFAKILRTKITKTYSFLNQLVYNDPDSKGFEGYWSVINNFWIKESNSIFTGTFYVCA